MQQLLKKIRRTLNDKKNRRQASRVVSSLCCVIVFVTTYAMVLPAITMEQQAQCGIEAHQHYDSCYELQPVCGLEESADHAHTDACYEKVLICGKEAHVHSKACYTDAGKEMLEKVFTAAQDMEQVSAEEAMGAAGGSSETQTADTPAVASGDAQSAGADSAVSGAQGTDPAFSDAQGTDPAFSDVQGTDAAAEGAQGASNSGTASPSSEETAEGTNSDPAGNSAAGDFEEFAPVQPGQADSSTDINGNTGEYASEDKSGEAGATDAADTAEISAPAQDAGAGTDAAAEDTNMTEAQETAAMSEDMPALIFEDTILIQTATATAKQTDAETATDAQTGAENQTDAGISPARDLLPAETNVTVHVEAEEGTFPAGTSMVLATVQEEALDKVAEAVTNSVEGTSHSFQAVDISFHDASGNEIEPAKPVRVTMTSDAIKTASETPEIAEPVVLHMVNEGEAEDAKDISLQEDSVQFEGESFSIYAVVYTLEYVIETESGIYKVTVTYGPDAKIPEGAALEVTEFSREDEEYTAAREAIIEKLRTEKEDFNESLFDLEAFDITIMGNDGQPIEPETPVKVLVRMNQLPDNSDEKTLSDTMSIHHLDESTGHTVAETVAEAKDISVGEGAASAEFMVGSFSTFTISWDKSQAVSTVSYLYAVSSNTNAWYFDDEGHSSGNKSVSQNSLYVMGGDGLPVSEGVFRANSNGVAKADIYLVYNTTDSSWRVNQATEAESTFHIYFNKYNNGGRYADVTFHYVGTDGKRLPRTQKSDITLVGSSCDTRGDINLQNYMGNINYYNYPHMEFRGNDESSHKVTVHYGYMNGGTFTEFDALPEGAQTSYGGPGFVGDQLNVRYDISGKDYVVTMLNDPVNGTPISPLLQTEKNNAFYWRYRIQSTTSVNGGINEWIPFESDDSDIYVIYRDTPIEKSYDTGDIDPADLGAPAASKAFESNHDGTYDLILGVTGKSNQAEQKTHANIVIVLDTSSSMDNTYSENPKKELGYTRLSAAKSAICDLADQLFGLNSTEDPAAIELAFVNFSHRVRNEQTMQTIYSGTDASSFKSMINATTGNGGTNYDTAIEAANSILWKDADPTYVVFVTDGDTVSRGYLKYDSSGDGSDHASDWDGGTYYNGDTATYGDTYLERAREAAKIQVDKVLDSGKKFYSIGVFGNVAYLGEMGGNYLGQANDKEAIETAFSKIISEIQLDLGYKDVVVNDGLTALTSTTLEHGAAGNFSYYRSGGLKDGREKYDSTKNNGRGESWNIEGTDKEAFFLEIKDANTFYKNGSKWTDITAEQKAAYIEKYGIGTRTVIWDLGEEMLEDGVTYKVAFTIWPCQDAYDLVADLNNKTVKFDDLDDSVKAQIVESGGVYYVRTNTKATVDFTSVRTENGKITEQKPGSATIKDPEGKMNLDTSIMTVRKEFAHLINEADPYEKIVFYLLVDGKYYNKDGTLSDTLDESKVYAINLPKDNKWEDQIYIAPGLMRGGEILETGHNYSIEEKIVSGNPYEYEFAPQTVRPMVITAVPTFLVEKDTFNTNQDNKKEYTFNDAESSYEEVEGKSDADGTYYVASENDGSLVGVNHKTSELDITKIIRDPGNLISDAQEASDTFTYRVTLQIPDGCDPSGIVGYEYVPRTQSNAFTLFGYQTGQSAFAEDIERFNGKTFRAWNTLVYDALIEYDRITENGKTFIKARRDADGKIIWKIPAEGGYHTITYDMTLKQDEVIRFTNLPTGTKYSIQEIYANKYPADNTGGKTDGRAPVNDPSNLSAEGYEIEKVQHTGGSLSADKTTVAGTIEAPDTRYYNQFTNKKVKEDKTTRAELKVKKVVEDYTWGEEYYRFTLKAGTAEYSDTEGGSGTSPMPYGTENSVVSIYNTTADHTLSFGTIRYTRPGTYTYTVSEYDNSKNMPNVQFASPVTLTVKVTADNEGNLTVASITDDGKTTVFSAESGAALATGLTTQTNTTKRIHIKKVDKTNLNKVLADAEFEIWTGRIKMYLQNGKLLDAEAVETIIEMPVSAKGAESAMVNAGISTTFTLGEIDISGFMYDIVYELKETAAPAGYVITNGSVYFKAVHENEKSYLRLTDQEGNVLVNENKEPILDNDSAKVSETDLSISIKNEPGVELPATGGPGTTLLYLLGIMLTGLAGAGLVMKRLRRNVA